MRVLVMGCWIKIVRKQCPPPGSAARETASLPFLLSLLTQQCDYPSLHPGPHFCSPSVCAHMPPSLCADRMHLGTLNLCAQGGPLLASSPPGPCLCWRSAACHHHTLFVCAQSGPLPASSPPGLCLCRWSAACHHHTFFVCAQSGPLSAPVYPPEQLPSSPKIFLPERHAVGNVHMPPPQLGATSPLPGRVAIMRPLPPTFEASQW